MKMTEVKSSNVHSVGFDDGRLHVRYRTKDGPGSLYTYPATPDQHAECLAAESIGKWLGGFKAAKDDDGNLLHPHLKVDESTAAEQGT